MRTAVSVPDHLVRAAEQHARRAQKPRSPLYADALTEYRARHAPDEVTAAMDRVVDALGPGPDTAPDGVVAGIGGEHRRRAEHRLQRRHDGHA